MRRPGRAAAWLLPLLFLLAGWPGTAAAVERLRAAQVTYLEAASYPEAAVEFRRMRSQGFDTVILRVFHLPGDRYYGFVTARAEAGVYFATAEAPVVEDILTPLIPLARAAGLRVFAWMSTLSTPLRSPWDLQGRRFDLKSEALVPTGRLDPFHPEVRRRLLVLYRDLGRYDLDGILLQDDLVLRHTEGFSAAALSAYGLASGRHAEPLDFYRERALGAGGMVRVSRYSPAFWDWARWKNRALLDLADQLRRSARGSNPELRFAINLMYEVLTNPEGGLAWLSQDYEATRRRGFDYLALMAYHRQMARELDLPVEETMETVAAMVEEGVGALPDPAALLVKLQGVDFDHGGPVAQEELERVAERVAAAGPVSLAVFPYRTRSEPAPWPGEER